MLVEETSRKLSPEQRARRATEKGADRVARRRYQQGCLFIRGKKRKLWVLRYREDTMLPSGETMRVNRSEIIGTLAEFPTRRIAQRIVESKLRPINLGVYRPKTTLTFREFVETQWEPNIFPTLKLSTKRGYAFMLRKYLNPYFGEFKMTEITRQMVQAFVAHLGQHLGPKSLCLAKNVLSKVFSIAIEWDYVEHNPAIGVRLPSLIAQRERIALTPAQIRKLVEGLPEPSRSMVLIAVLTGLRRGELFALRWGAVDFERNLIHVRESVYEGRFGTPKTRSSFRKLPMCEGLEKVFLALRGTNAAPDDLVFVSKNGKTPVRPENVLKRIIHSACVRLGLPKVGWHDLRHTSATLLHAHEPLRVTQAILGHSDLQTTLGYTHVLPGWQREAMKRLEDAVLFPNVPKSEEEPKGENSIIQ
ncbi:MAG TPA: site-specific integrase [Candidatus Acidoferrales bacterium]|nr:site-specific integrase [Candidatus Acidoferrales bacterium]